jgi:tetratricopeptide (TPR) repeat protein
MAKTRKNIKISSKQPMDPLTWRNIFYRYPVVFLVLLCFLVYIWTLRLKLIEYDDSYFIVMNSAFNKNPANIIQSFLQSLYTNFDSIYYRPVFQIDMIIEYFLFGAHPAGYHLTNLLFHVLSVILVYLFFRKLKLEMVPAFLLSALFAVHPVLSQAVAWIPGRNDILLMIFLLSGILVTINYLETSRLIAWIGQLVLFLIALFTKETAVVTPFIIIVLITYVLKFNWNKIIPLAAGWIIAIIVWYVFRHHAIAGKDIPGMLSMFSTAPARLLAILQYLGKIILPVNLSVFPVMKDVSITWGLIALIILIALIWISKSHREPLTIFGLFWFLIFIFPVIIIPTITNDNLFEHRLYIPIIGILLILSRTFLFTGKTKNKVKLIIFVPVILLFAVLSFFRLDYFKDPLSFWTRAALDSPRSCIPIYRHLSLVKSQTEEEKEKIWIHIHTVDPYYPGVLNALGEICLKKHYAGLAEKYLKEEVNLFKYPAIYYDLARLYLYKNRSDSVLFYLTGYHRMLPSDSKILIWMAYTFLDLKQPEKADKLIGEMRNQGVEVPQDLEKLTYREYVIPVEKNEKNTQAWDDIRTKANSSLGSLFLNQKDYFAAESCFQRSLIMQPDSTDSYFNLAKVAFYENKWSVTIDYLQKLVKIDPLNKQANNNLADLYFRLNEKEKARKVIDFMKKNKIEINPKLLNLQY